MKQSFKSTILGLMILILVQVIFVHGKLKVFKPRAEKESPYEKKKGYEYFNRLFDNSMLFNSSYNMSNESRLRYTILNDYDASLRPVNNSTTPSLISVSLSNLQVVGLVNKH